MEKLRMGVLGCSGHYSLRVATPLKASLLVAPYAVASRDAAKAGQFAKTWGFQAAYGSYEDLLADPKVDFVYIPLPNHLHLEYIKKSADAGKPVLCEKPLCLNAKEAAEAAAYCEKKGIPLMEAFMYRFHPQWVRAAELVRAGELGKVLSTLGVFTYNNKDGANIRNRADCGGGAVLDIGCYMASTSRLLMGGEPQRVAATLVRDPVFKTDILSSAIFDYGEGRVSTFTVSTQMFPTQTVIACGSGGNLSVEVPFNMFGDVPGRLTVTTSVAKRVVESAVADQYLLLFDAFARSLVERVEVPLPASDAVANMAALDAVFAAAASGGWEKVARY
ncbi:MAG: Gfo/Idh/MocA family oxidoreductase [Spirochaetes bacterium]|nr:Gfo/Idh/MocA family oxidoreductase [Spirochaetota bacterium]